MPDQLGKIMTAMDPSDVAQMAMIECLRQIADGNKKMGSILDGMQSEIRDVRERLIRIEASEFKSELKAMDVRIDALELDRAGRTGGRGMLDDIAKYGPIALAIVGALFIVLISTGRIVL